MRRTKIHKCPRDGCDNMVNIHLRFGVLPCSDCQIDDRKTTLTESPEFATQAQTNRVTEGRSKNAKDIIQPFIGKNHEANPDFVKNYPERARDYFNDEQLRKL